MAGAAEAIGMSVTNLNFVFKILILYWNIHVNVQVHWIVSETENQVFLLQIYSYFVQGCIQGILSWFHKIEFPFLKSLLFHRLGI